MAPIDEERYKELFHPIKDPEKSFEINIAKLVQSYLADLELGHLPPNFNSAALVLQGTSSIFSKKVECLHSLVTKFLQALSSKQKKNDSQGKKDASKPKDKEKADKSDNLFLSTEIKLSKNLSYLRKKNSQKSVWKKKPSQKLEKKFSLRPVYLLPLDDENKGNIFYDVKGTAVGHKGDFVLNLCKLTSYGWILLPTFNPDDIPENESVGDYTMVNNEVDESCSDANACQDDGMDDSSSPVAVSPDEGIGSATCTPNEDCQSNMVHTEGDEKFPPSTDEGIGTDGLFNTPECENASEKLTDGLQSALDEIENIPLDDVGNSDENPSINPIRNTVRKAFDVCQLESGQENPSDKLPEELTIKRAIQKRNTICLPAKLKMNGSGVIIKESLAEYCNRTFYNIENKDPNNNSPFALELYCLTQHAGMRKKYDDNLAKVKKVPVNKNKDNEQASGDEMEVAADDPVELAEDDLVNSTPFEDGDVQINNDPEIDVLPADGMSHSDNDVNEGTPLDVMELAKEQVESYMKEVQQYVLTSDISEKVHQWEVTITPFLTEQEEREEFDINSYGAFILNSFEDSDRKQTKSFKEICKGLKKWQIHRYFMALLPLANIGNVDLETEIQQDGTEEIMVTLLSRKMHHKELEKFGHNDGSHD